MKHNVLIFHIELWTSLFETSYLFHNTFKGKTTNRINFYRRNVDKINHTPV